MIGIAVVLLMAGGWLLALLAVGWAAGRLCGLNDRLPPPRRWVDEQSGRPARVSFTRAEDGAPLPSGQNPVPSGEARAQPPRRVEADTPGRHIPLTLGEIDR